MANNKKKIEFGEKPAPKKNNTQNPPAISNALDNFEFWFAENWKKAAVGIAVIVAIIAIVVITMHVRKVAAAKLQNEFANAVTLEQLDAVIAAHPDHSMCCNARFRRADLYLEKGDYAKAYEDMKAIAVQGVLNGTPAISAHERARAALAAAALLENMNKLDEAILEYDKIAADLSLEKAFIAEASYSAARIRFQKGDKDGAAKSLAKINFAQASAMDDPGYAIWAKRAIALSREINGTAVKAAPAPAKAAEKPAAKAPAKKK